MNAIAGELNQRGILTPNGGQWWATSVRNLLNRSPPKELARVPASPRVRGS